MKEEKSSTSYSAWIIITSQILLYIFAAYPLRLWYRAKRILPNDLKPLRRGSLIVANHQSHVDGFYVILALPFVTYLKLLPFRYPSADHVLRNPLWNPSFFPFLQLLGCFSIGKTSADKMKSLFYIRDLLLRGSTVVLFPEGRITKEREVTELKKGIKFFMAVAVNVTFVRLRGFNKKTKDLERCSIRYSDVMEPSPEWTMEEIRDYFNSL